MEGLLIGVIGIILALELLIFLAYRGFSVIVFAPIFALIAALLSGMALMPTYTEIFLPNLASYVKVYFPFFLLGAIFGGIAYLEWRKRKAQAAGEGYGENHINEPALVIGIMLAFSINPKGIKGNLAKAINTGAIGSLLAVMNTASEVGFGNVIKSLPGFKSIAHALFSYCYKVSSISYNLDRFII